MTGLPENAGDLPDAVRELVATMRARVSKSATSADIRVIAEQAAARAAGDIRTLDEVRRLADVALERAQRIGDLMGRLTSLTGEDRRGP